MPGKGQIHFTGNLRPVTKESAATAVSYVRARAADLMLDPEWLKAIDLHLHVPRGGVVRDAAGLGIPMFAAVASLLLGIPTRPEVAATGEITLRGSVLPVGVLKDKVLAAHRAGITEIVLPEKNAADLEEIPREILDDIVVRLVKNVDEVPHWMLGPPPPNRTSTPPARTSGPPSGEMHP